MVAKEMTEGVLQEKVIRLARSLGWLVYHTHDSRRSVKGFPDLVLVHPRRGVLWRELKTMKGRLTAEQTEWLTELGAAGQDAKVWRPDQWVSDEIAKELGL